MDYLLIVKFWTCALFFIHPLHTHTCIRITEEQSKLSFHLIWLWFPLQITNPTTCTSMAFYQYLPMNSTNIHHQRPNLHQWMGNLLSFCQRIEDQKSKYTLYIIYYYIMFLVRKSISIKANFFSYVHLPEFMGLYLALSTLFEYIRPSLRSIENSPFCCESISDIMRTTKETQRINYFDCSENEKLWKTDKKIQSLRHRNIPSYHERNLDLPTNNFTTKTQALLIISQSE